MNNINIELINNQMIFAAKKAIDQALENIGKTGKFPKSLSINITLSFENEITPSFIEFRGKIT